MITGERVTTANGGLHPTFQRHVAAYRLCAPLLPAGRVLDLGCGTGHSYRELSPRPSVGVDLDAAALAGQDRETVRADMRALPLADGSFQSVISVQSIEHVHDAGLVLAEVVQVQSIEISPRYRAIYADERRDLDRLLHRDPLRLRRLSPRRPRRRLYDWRPRNARAVPRAGVLEVGPEDFWLSEQRLALAVDLVAICDRD